MCGLERMRFVWECGIGEWSVKERGEERLYCTAGEMSRNEGEEEEELFVRTVFLL